MRERRRQHERQRRQEKQAHVGDGTGGVESLLLLLEAAEEKAATQNQQHVAEHRPEQRSLVKENAIRVTRARGDREPDKSTEAWVELVDGIRPVPFANPQQVREPESTF